ncbi:tetratricopeptide repeat protein [Thalassospira sp.]|uniref:tetratricopeptide repeat protein n=1 Tax=Thalassospira sp. TaxID=1912094 RepID=UPI002733D24E|nr:tetratricopeptide repeat protein [Thalassospira sp.]MDP2699361.1 tetratricopeptide repeat protein [Thalassospira sp.]
MTTKDRLGLILSGASDAGRDHYETALTQFQCYIGDPVASVDAAIKTDPGFVMAHVLKAYLHLMGTEPAALPVARACLADALKGDATPRECGHIAAIDHLIAGRWHAASRVLEDIAINNPSDILALQVGHLIDFFTGRSRLLRDRIARAIGSWDDTMPGYHVMLGMYAFGLEETGHYGRAEAIGRKGVELNPRDGWAQHAVAHVMEMQGRTRDGIAWMTDNADSWSQDSFFSVHNWWHLALYHLENEDINAVLDLYDGPINGGKSGVIMEMIDASALLWRLHLRGIDVGDRWQDLVAKWEPVATAGNYAFNDLHAAMACVGAGKTGLADSILDAQEGAMRRKDDNARFTGDVGNALTKGVLAFGTGDYARTIELLRPVRDSAHQFGGSHAQRDIIDLTLIEASLRGGNQNLARALASERRENRPESPLSLLFARRAEAAGHYKAA